MAGLILTDLAVNLDRPQRAYDRCLGSPRACGDGSQLPLQGSLRGFDSSQVHDPDPVWPRSLHRRSTGSKSLALSGKNWQGRQAPIAERIQHRSTEPKISVRFWVGVRKARSHCVLVSIWAFQSQGQGSIPCETTAASTCTGPWDWNGELQTLGGPPIPAALTE